MHLKLNYFKKDRSSPDIIQANYDIIDDDNKLIKKPVYIKLICNPRLVQGKSKSAVFVYAVEYKPDKITLRANNLLEIAHNEIQSNWESISFRKLYKGNPYYELVFTEGSDMEKKILMHFTRNDILKVDVYFNLVNHPHIIKHDKYTKTSIAFFDSFIPSGNLHPDAKSRSF